MTYSSVIVGTEGSSTAATAVRHAGALARDNHARLVVVTAYEPRDDELAKQSAGVPDDIRWTLTDRAQAEEKAVEGRQIAHEVGASGVVAHALPGSPPDVLLEAAQDFAADVIVVGSKGLTGLPLIRLGSVASAVSHHAPCDVLIVHTT